MNDRARIGRLPPELQRALAPVIREARGSGVRVALVGGIVRDLLRGGDASRDIDLLVEGDAIELARRVGRRENGLRVQVHPRFGTATIEGASGPPIDLAGARRESYARPGALPDVEPATIEEDLARRDFTVNAIAWEPPRAPGGSGRLHDPLGGAADLAAGRLRILHPRSFEDDPTRILRAVRYASRLGLSLEPKTRRLLKDALASGALATVSGDRIRRELVKAFSEKRWESAMRTAGALGVLAALHSSWRITPAIRSALRRAESLASRSRVVPAGDGGEKDWMAALLVAAANLRGSDRAQLSERLALTGADRRVFEGLDARTGHPSREETIARAALAPRGARRLRAERALLAPARLSIRGSDLIEAGIPAGPAVGRALGQTRRALEEGRIRPGGREEELEFAVAAARRDPARAGHR